MSDTEKLVAGLRARFTRGEPTTTITREDAQRILDALEASERQRREAEEVLGELVSAWSEGQPSYGVMALVLSQSWQRRARAALQHDPNWAREVAAREMDRLTEQLSDWDVAEIARQFAVRLRAPKGETK